MRTVLNGEIAFYDLGLTYTYMAAWLSLSAIVFRPIFVMPSWEVAGFPVGFSLNVALLT